MGSERHPEERLAALIDGELSGADRERVLAHLVHCSDCKTEVEAQRRTKEAFAQCELPAPPAGLMARLQGLPAGPSSAGVGDGDAGRQWLGREPMRWPRKESFLPSRRNTVGVPVPVALPMPDGTRSANRADRQEPTGGRPEEQSAAASGAVSPTAVVPAGDPPLSSRAPQRGHRFAFAAAGAFSLAAFAIGGAVTAAPSGAGPAASGPPAMASSGSVSPSSPARLPGREEQLSPEQVLRSGTPQEHSSLRTAVMERALGSGLPALFRGESPSRVASEPAPHRAGGPEWDGNSPAGVPTSPEAQASPGATPHESDPAPELPGGLHPR